MSKKGRVLKSPEKKRWKRVKFQHKKAAVRAKYGPLGKPAPVTVRRIGEDDQTVDQTKFARQGSFALDQRAQAAGFATYQAYLASPHWRKIRRSVLIRDKWRCRLCGSSEHLHVHHDRYDFGLASDSIVFLKTFCERCHRRVHRR